MCVCVSICTLCDQEQERQREKKIDNGREWESKRKCLMSCTMSVTLTESHTCISFTALTSVYYLSPDQFPLALFFVTTAG